MDSVRVFLVSLMITPFVASVFGGFNVGRTNSSASTGQRNKRGLIFENGGSMKLVIGPILPIRFDDPIVWRSLICGHNIHLGHYKIPSTPLYPWDKWENIYARSGFNSRIEPDESREFVYLALEYFMDKYKGNGRECLLRSICENAQVDQHMDLFGEILNEILTPGKEKLDPVYREAYEMGKAGVDCIDYFKLCPRGTNIFDRYFEEET